MKNDSRRHFSLQFAPPAQMIFLPILEDHFMQSKKDQGRGLAARQRHIRRDRPSPHVIEPFEPRLLLSVLPANHRAWETVPGVIRNDGIETFVVEIEPGAAVNRITFTN